MNNFLRQIGLITDLTLQLPVERADFEKALRLHLDKPQADFLDIFSSSDKLYKGTVTHDSFEIRRRRRFFDGSMSFVRTKGQFTQKSDKLIIDLELNAFHPLMMPFVVLALGIYLWIAVFTFTSEGAGASQPWIPFFILIHAAVMFGIPYIIMRRRLKLTRYEIERDLFFMIKDMLPTKQY